MGGEVDDAELAARVTRAVAGDPGAMAEVMGVLRPAIYRYCRSRLASRETAEDVTQEVCLAMVTALPSYQDRGLSVRAFAFGIASRQVAQSYRRQARRPEIAHGELPDSPDTTDGPETIVERGVDIAQAQALLATLNETQRDILMLRVAGGLSTAEVAEALSMTPGAVRVAQHRALNTLRALAPSRDLT